MESALKRPTQSNGGHQTSAISFRSSRFGKLVLPFSDAEYCCFRDVYKIGFIMISVSVHVTLKSVNASKLLVFIFISLAPAWLISTNIIPKHA